MRKPHLMTIGARSRQAFSVVAATAFLFTIPATASAAMFMNREQPDIVTRINLTDLDLTSDRGVERLHRRLTLKARRYCRQILPVSATPSMHHECADRVVGENMGKLHQAIDEAKAMRPRS